MHFIEHETINSYEGKIDFTAKTTDQEHPLGLRYVDRYTNDTHYTQYVYIKAHDSLSAYNCYQVATGFTIGSEVTTTIPNATRTGVHVVIPQLDVDEGDYFWAPYSGNIKIKADETGVLSGDFFYVLDTMTEASASPLEAAESLGVALTDSDVTTFLFDAIFQGYNVEIGI